MGLDGVGGVRQGEARGEERGREEGSCSKSSYTIPL